MSDLTDPLALSEKFNRHLTSPFTNFYSVCFPLSSYFQSSLCIHFLDFLQIRQQTGLNPKNNWCFTGIEFQRCLTPRFFSCITTVREEASRNILSYLNYQNAISIHTNKYIFQPVKKVISSLRKRKLSAKWLLGSK